MIVLLLDTLLIDIALHTLIPNKSAVFLAGAAKFRTPMSAIYLRSRGYIILGRLISDTRTMRWEIQWRKSSCLEQAIYLSIRLYSDSQ